MESKKNLVVHVLTSLDFGGVEKRMEMLAEASGDGSMNHRFIAINQGGAAAAALAEMGIQVDCLQRSPVIPSVSAFLALVRRFRELRPTVVHTHGAEANFHGLLAARVSGVPVRIGEEIGIPEQSRQAKFVFTQVFRLAGKVIGISDAVTGWLVESGEVPASKAVRIYNPVRIPVNPPTKRISGEAFRIGFVGRLELVKNPLAVVDACALLVERGIPAEVRIVGDGSERPKLEERISELKLQNRVRLYGYQQDPISIICDCDVYVQPSISEGFGIALVEAMGCGLPVIATAVGGASEFIIHGQNGWLLDEPSAISLANLLQRAFEYGRPVLREIGAEARASVLERFEPAAYLQHLELLYSSLLANNHDGSAQL